MIPAERYALLETLQCQLGYTFQNISLLNQALTHRSYAHEISGGCEDYERLEFLGDTILSLLISEELYARHPHAREGTLSQLRAGLVSQPTLATVARQLDLGRFLLLGRGEEQSGGRDKASILAAGFEAVVAALYREGGMATARRVVLGCFAALFDQVTCLVAGQDWKGVLQAWTLNAFGCLPTYQVVGEEGPAHQKTFHVQLSLQQGYGCVGVGRSKKAAEQHAAQQLLTLLQQAGDTTAGDLAGG